MKLRNKNPIMKKAMEDFMKAGTEKPVWKAVAKGLNKPRRQRYEVNLSRIEKFAAEKDTVVVPGVVLGEGQISKHVTVAAVRFSVEARKKIERAGGKCMFIEELLKKEPDASKVRIMG
jgi:large subunit ribosomal protein L18e